MATLGNTTVLSLNVLNNITTSGTITGNGSGLTNVAWNNVIDKPNILPYTPLNGGLLTATTTSNWGIQTGSEIASFYDDAGGGLKFRKNCPSNGKMSMILDGTVYVNEGNDKVLDTSGGSVTGELKLYAASGDSPRLTFQRGELTDSYNDWSIYDSAGTLYLQQRGGGSTAWETRGAIDQYGVNFIGTIAEDGTLLANKYVTIGTDQTISGAKTFSNTITANNWLYVPYIGTKTAKLYIEGPWSQNGQEQPTLTFEDGALKAYNWEDDGESVYESMFDFRFPYGVQMSASGASIYLNGNTNCYLQSTAKGWMVNGSDTYGCIYPAATHNGRIGLSTNHFFEGWINYIYANNIYPVSTNGTSSGYNIGNVGTSSKYFSSGAFRTVYRSSESGLSDIRLKQNISNNDLNALEIINNLNIINFQYDDDIKIEAKNKKQRLKAINTMKELPKTKETKELRKELQKIIATPNNEDMITIGVSAQQLQELLPKKYQKTFIQKESTNQYADQLFIRENRLVYLSFKAIQEQQTIIDSLEEKINLLEEKINALEEKKKKEVN